MQDGQSRSISYVLANRNTFWLATILAVALAVRLIGIDYSLWYDEIATTQFASTPFALLWSDWIIRETNPPLYYSLLHGWIYLFGDSDTALRMFSVSIGLIGIVLLFFLGATLFGPRVGLVAAALTSLSAQHIYYSQQVRAYALSFTAGVAVTLAGVLLKQALLAKKPLAEAWPIYTGFVLANAVAVYTHTILVLLTFLVTAWVLASLVAEKKSSKSAIGVLAFVSVVILSIWAWWGRITILQLSVEQTNLSWIVRPSLPYAIRLTLEAFTPWSIGVPRFVTSALAVLAAVIAFKKWPRAASLPATILVGAPTLLFLISLKSPIYLSRTIFWASSDFTLLVSASLFAPKDHRSRTAVIALALLVSIWNVAEWWPTRQIEPWRRIVSDVVAIDPDALVFVQGRGAALAMQRYCEAPLCELKIVSIKTDADDRWVTAFAPRLEVDTAQAENLLRQRRQAILIDWKDFRPGDNLNGLIGKERQIDVSGLNNEMKVKLVDLR